MFHQTLLSQMIYHRGKNLSQTSQRDRDHHELRKGQTIAVKKNVRGQRIQKSSVRMLRYA